MQKLVDSEGLAKMFDESGVVEMVEVSCLQVMQKLVDSEGLAKMFDESGVVEMVEVYPVTFSLLQIWVLECICLCVCLSSVCQISHFNWKS